MRAAAGCVVSMDRVARESRAWPSISVLSPQPRREPQDELNPFKLGQPVGCSGGKSFDTSGNKPGRACGPELLGRQATVRRQRPLAIPAHFKSIFAHKDDHGDAVTTID